MAQQQSVDTFDYDQYIHLALSLETQLMHSDIHRNAGSEQLSQFYAQHALNQSSGAGDVFALYTNRAFADMAMVTNGFFIFRFQV